MKKILITTAAVLSFAFLNAQEGNNNQGKNNAPVSTDYCLQAKGDILVLMSGGKEISEDIKLKNGDRLSANGRLTRADGTEVKLKEGECVNDNGVVNKPGKN